ncbi:MAG: glycoside hydrolase family 88 protein [Planctomycetota bacterium]|nr:glycoside hydrolase family 88 protein [Planctomycetota bacterium]
MPQISLRDLRLLLVVVSGLITAQSARADDVKLLEISQVAGNTKLIHSAIGVTRKDTKIECLIHADDLNHKSPHQRLLLVGGLDGSAESANCVLRHVEAFYAELQTTFPKIRISAVPLANPDGLKFETAPANASGGQPLRGYPPKSAAYNSPTDPEAAYLWRWIGMHAPDLVVVVEVDASLRFATWSTIPDHESLAKLIVADTRGIPADHLVQALHSASPSNIGTIPAVRLRIPKGHRDPKLLMRLLSNFRNVGISPARTEMIRRLDRSPAQVAKQLTARYGHELNAVAYIPALALVGRIRVGDSEKDASHLKDVERIVKPYVDGRATLSQRTSGSNLSGHLVFGVLADATKNRRYVELAKAAADLGFEADGNLKMAMPAHVEMSDSVFMGCPILAQVGRLTGERKYFDMAVKHMRFMVKLNVRPDGLHRHSPLDQAAWGRGNGFPALGLAWTLSDMPESHPGREEMLREFQSHIRALTPHQDPTGAWHQVIDREESYRELTSTCMITFAIVRGIRKGWLKSDTYRPVVAKAWRALRTRIAANGTLVDVGTGTGKQPNLRAYYDRTAILGADARGGAMSLMVTTELAAWLRESGLDLD